MPTARRHRPRFETLENRTVPAILLQLDSSGDLIGIFGVPDGNVTLTFMNDDEVNVMENANDLGTYNVPGDLTISLGNTVDSLTHTVDFGGFAMSGSLSVTLGNSPSLTALEIINGDASGISGELRIKTGNGPDSVRLMTDVAGNVTVNTAYGDDEVTLDAGSDIQGNFTGTGINDFFMNDIGGPATVEGNVSLSTSEAIPVDYNFFGNNVDGNTVIGGNLLIRTGSGQAPGDLVLVQGTVLNNVIVNLGQGPNTFTLDSTSIVGGSVNYRGGNGNDVVNLASDALGGTGSVVLGNVTVNMGNGVNELVIDSDTTIGGSAITYIGGNGTDSLTFRGNAVGARLYAQLRGGADEAIFDDPDAELASLYIDFGTGVDALLSPGFVFDFPTTFRNLP